MRLEIKNRLLVNQEQVRQRLTALGVGPVGSESSGPGDKGPYDRIVWQAAPPYDRANRLPKREMRLNDANR